MRITYYALRPLQVGDDVREPGDLVPEAASWNYLSGYVSDGKLAPVLVATLPEEQQVMLLEWEEAMVAEFNGTSAPVPTPEPVDAAVEPPAVTPEGAEAKQEQKTTKTAKVK